MPGLLIIAHEPLASSLKAVALHAYPECAQVMEALDVPPGAPLEWVESQAIERLKRVRDPEALILTDVFGATPCNVAQRLADGRQVRVVTGVNVPMVWRTLCYRGETLEAALARALSGATQGVMQVAPSAPRAQEARSGDQATHHDQQ